MSDPTTPDVPTLELEIFADYFQFTLEDEQTAGQRAGTVIELPDDWWKQLSTQMLAVDAGVIWVSTVRNMSVPVSVTLLGNPPVDELAAWDHVAEASIAILSGKLVIAGVTGYLPDEPRLPVEPGTYRVRVYFGGLERISEDGLDGEDHYAVVLWPAEYGEPATLKKWPSVLDRFR